MPISAAADTLMQFKPQEPGPVLVAAPTVDVDAKATARRAMVANVNGNPGKT